MEAKSSPGSCRLTDRERAPLVASAQARISGNCASCAHPNACAQPGSDPPARANASTRPSVPAACRPLAAAAPSGSRASIAAPPTTLPMPGFFAAGASCPAAASPSLALNRSPGSSCISVAASKASRVEPSDFCLRSRARQRSIKACSSRSLRWGRSGFSDKPGDLAQSSSGTGRGQH